MGVRRPGALTFVAVVAIVVGVTTALTALSNAIIKTVPFAAAPPAPAAPPPVAADSADGADGATTPTPTPNPVIAAQLEMQRRVAEVKQRYRGFFLGALPFALLAGGILILGGARAFSLRRGWRPLLLAGMALGLVVELISAKPQLSVQLEVTDATSTMMKTMFETVNTAPAAAGTARSMVEAMGTFARVSAMAGLVFAFAIVAAKVVFFVFGLVYLTRARALLADGAPPPS